MFDEFELGTSWVLKNNPTGAAYTVIDQAISSTPDHPYRLDIGFDVNGELVTRPLTWAVENLTTALK